MKKIFLSLIASLIITSSVSAQIGDIYYVAKGDKCHIIKYRCGIGSDFYSDNTGCGCEQILSDEQMQKADALIERFISKIHILYSDIKDQELILGKIRTRIKNLMFENRENQKFQVLGLYLQSKIFELHGNEF